MGRSRPGRRPAPRATLPEPRTPPPGAGLEPGPSLASATLPRVWRSVGYRPLLDAAPVAELFDFAALPWPGVPVVAYAWGAFDRGDRLLGALVAERAEASYLFHGPVVQPVEALEPDGAPVEGRLDIAGQLVAAALDHAAALGATRVFSRPQGLDRIWVRHGFIPVPEGALPPAFAGRAGVGLYAWQRGSALWSLRERTSE